MFGLKRRKATTGDLQIPYQVYETVNEPNVRRSRLLIRLAVALVIVTVLVVGFLLIRSSSDDQSAGVPAGASQQFLQAPQDNAQLPAPAGEPAGTPLSGETSNRTVDQPQ